MSKLIIEEHFAERLQDLAMREKRPVEEVLASLLDLYTARADSLAAMDGMFDDDVPDLSATVRETMASFYKREYGPPG